jgi:hypothetical protein
MLVDIDLDARPKNLEWDIGADETDGNYAPTVASSIPDTTVNENNPAINNYRDLNNVFTDLDEGSALTFSIESNSDTILITVSIGADSALDLSFAPDSSGVATIIIRATDSLASFVEDTFVVTVNGFFPSGWVRKCELVIQASKVDTSLTDFPVLFTQANLPSDMFDADGSNPALNGGGDIRFSTDSDGWNQLSLEIVDFTTNNDPGLGTAEIWVKVDSLSSSVNKSVWVWYNKSGEVQPASDSSYGSESVWDGSYKGVWHLESDFSDATVDSNDGTNYGSTNASAKIGDGQNFPGVNEYIEIPNDTELENIQEGEYTIAGWFNPDQVPPGSGSDNDANYAILTKTGYMEGAIYKNDSTLQIDHWLTGDVWEGASSSPDSYSPGSANYIVGVVSKTDGETKVYVNGSLKQTKSWTPGTAAREFGTETWKIGIGIPGASTYRWAADGVIDEVRISNIDRSDGWISTQYNTQNSPSTFVLSGTCEAAVNNTPTIASAIPDTTVNEDNPPIDNYRDLNSVFSDIENGSALTFSIESNSNPSLVTATIDSDSALDLSFAASTSGSATLVIRATDSGALYVEDQVVVTVSTLALNNIARALLSGDITVTWVSVASSVYDIYYADSLNGTFIDVADVTASGDSSTWVDDGPGLPGTVTFEEVQTGGAAGSGDPTTVTTSLNLTGVTDHLYLASLVTKPGDATISVDSVYGLGLTWTLVKSQCGAQNIQYVEVWKAQGSPSLDDGPVSADISNPSSLLNSVALTVSRYSGVDPSSPVGTVVSANSVGVNGICSGGADSSAYSVDLTTTSDNSVAYGAVAIRSVVHTPGTGYTERVEFTQGAGANIAGIAVEDSSIASTSTVAVNGTMSGGADWAVVAVEIKAAVGGTPSHPDSVTQRYYRVQKQGGSTTSNTVGKYTVSLQDSAMNMISTPFVPYSTSLSSVLSTQLTGASSELNADRIWKWSLVFSKYDVAWLVSGGPQNGKWWDTEAGEESNMTFGADEGFWLQNRNGLQSLTFVGEVSDTPNRTLNLGKGIQMIGSAYPVDVVLTSSDLWEDGAVGSNNELNADRVLWWDPVVNDYKYAWLIDEVGPPWDGKWWDSSTGAETTIKLKPGQGLWFEIRDLDGHGSFIWTYPKPYSNPPN